MQTEMEKEYEKLSNAYPEIEWSVASSEGNGVLTGKTMGKIVVNVFYPSRQFLLSSQVMDIIRYRHSFTDKSKWLIDNSHVLMSFDDNQVELGKILSFTAQDLKRYYIEQKKEEIHAAQSYYKEIYIGY